MVATSQRRRAPWPVEFYRSAVAKKWIMALTGIVLVGYLIAHLVGNLKVFLPPVDGVPEVDLYGHALRELLFPILPHHVALWLLRVGLLVAAAFHIHAAYSLTLMNRRARPVDYSGPRTYLAANYASRTMRWSGVIVILYVFFHLADFTWGIAPAAPDTWARGEVYANFFATFSRPGVVFFYVLANLCLGLHLFHGVWSMFQSLGANNPRFNRWRRYFAWTIAGVITAGNVFLPIAGLLGIGGPQ